MFIKKERKFKHELEKELKELRQKLDNNPNTETQNLYKLNKNELEQIEKDEVNKQIFKSRIKCTEDGETNSKFFLSLEKKNYTNKLIKALDKDGTIVKEPDNISKGQSTYYQALYFEKLNKNDKSYKDALNTFLKLNTMLMLNMKIHTKILKKIACIGQSLMYRIMEEKQIPHHTRFLFKCHLVFRYLH